MFRKATTNASAGAGASKPHDALQVYPKPKVLVVDMPVAASKALAAKGFNVSVGSFGKPYKVKQSSSLLPLIGKGSLPNYTEQEIVIVDLVIGDLADEPNGEKHRPDDEHDLWGKCDRGFIDPRSGSAFRAREAFDRVLASGGAFVVFADARTEIELQFARFNSYRKELYDVEPFPQDVWHFITELADMQVQSDHGTEMRACVPESGLGQLVAEHLGGVFTCTLQGGWRQDNGWVTLGENKFGQAVALCRLRGQQGSVIVLPQITDKAGFIVKMLTSVLPEVSPHLFPYIEGGKWTRQADYELPRVVQLRAKQAEIEQRTKAEVAALEDDVNRERAANGWLHDLLTGTDAQLVEGVKKALATVGFAKVIDVDEARDREGKSRREDLQIHDQSPLLVVDVKGMGAFPSDGDALQADKHAAILMRELKRTDVVGLSIINHQRHIPPLDRDNAMPFRQELLDAAEERTLGLMTAWDLYRLVKNFNKLGWQNEHVKPVFYRKGRIGAVPSHYQFVGIIAKAWTDKFGVVIKQGGLRVGDRVAVEFAIEFEEVPVDSIRVNDKDVQRVKSGDPAGILWPAGRPKLKEGMRVFRIPEGV